jgi:hypothetical protein
MVVERTLTRPLCESKFTQGNIDGGARGTIAVNI